MTTYGHIEVSRVLSFGPTGYAVDATRGTVLASDGTTTVAVTPPIGDRYFLASELTDAGNPTGLLWSQVTAGDIDLSVLAGAGLVYNGTSINVGPSETIGTTPTTTFVASGVRPGQALVSGLAQSLPAVWGALDLTIPQATSGSLPINRGGTGVAAFTPNTLLAADGSGALTFVTYDPDLITPIEGTATFTNDNPSPILDLEVEPGYTYIVRSRFSVYEFAGGSTTSTGVAGFYVDAIFSDQGGTWRRVNQFEDIKFAPSDTVATASIVASTGGNTGNIITFRGHREGTWKVTVDPLHRQPNPPESAL